MPFNGNLYSPGDAYVYGSPWTGKPYFRAFALEGNLESGYTPAIYDLLVKTSAGEFKKFDGDDILVSAESVTLVASAGQLDNKLDVDVVTVTDSPATTTYDYGTDYIFTDDGNIEAVGGGAIGATDTILVTYTHNPNLKIIGLLETYNGTTYGNTVLVELLQGELDLAKVNMDNATSATVLEFLRKKLKENNINVL